MYANHYLYICLSYLSILFYAQGVGFDNYDYDDFYDDYDPHVTYIYNN